MLRSRRRHLTGVSIVAVVVAVLASSCTFFSDSGDVAVVGDSITVLMGRGLSEQAPGFNWDIRAQVGFTAADMVDQAAELTGARPDQAVINLGTNDALQQVPVEDTASTLTLMIEGFGDAECIHLVTITTALPDQGEPRAADTAAAINDWIHRTAGERDDVSVVEWDERLQEDDGVARLLKDDRIHPNDEGGQVLAEMIVDAVRSC